MHPAEPVEFSRPLAVDRIAGNPSQVEIEADAAERAALAERFDLLSLDRFTARFTVRRLRKDLIRVKGRIAAGLVQACVVSLEPVRSRIEEPFDLVYAPESAVEEVGFGADTETEWPEPLPEGPLDIGEAVAQQLSLALDPYPRAPGAVIPEGRSEDSRSQNPFARLALLRKIAPGSGEA